MSGRLSVVATPIGNLADITQRALTVLREADAVLAEDTRRTKRLMAHHGLSTPLRSFHAHSRDRQVEALVDELAQGARLALVSDAGTPVISDPGIRLVAAARERGITVESIPGPSAVTAAVAVCGLRCDTFRFVGFLPRSGRGRRDVLASIAADPSATVLFEAPGRTAATLRDLAEVLEERRVAVCRELTKLHEEVVRGSAVEVADRFADGARGEVTIVVEATGRSEPEVLDDEALDALVDARLAEGLPPREIAREVGERSALSSSEAYRRVLFRKEQT